MSSAWCWVMASWCLGHVAHLAEVLYFFQGFWICVHGEVIEMLMPQTPSLLFSSLKTLMGAAFGHALVCV